jgi:site-specific DNA-adenine methylase
MGKSHLIGRIGSKTNDIKFFNHLLPLDVKKVVEPFGGSFAVIRDVYSDNKYKKYVNDNDEILNHVYNHMKDLKNGYEKWNVINNMDINTKEKIKEFQKDNSIHDLIKKYIVDIKVIKNSIAKSKNMDDVDDEIKKFKKINFTNEDAFETIEKHRKDKNTFIFLDPPYLFSDNSGYSAQNEKSDMTDYIFKIYDIMKDKKTKCKIMLIINDLKILRRIFQDFIKGDYNKIYQVGKKKMKHLIITNY